MQEVPFNHDSYSSWTVGSECNGGFAQYTSIRSSEAFSIISNWSDVELGSIPCAYSTAEGLLYRSKLKDEIVFITGGSGGVGSAAIQLAKLRGSKVIAQCSENKHKDVLRVGADKVIDRNSNIIQELGKNSVDVVIDLVAGDQWGQLLEILKPEGRYSTAGAIAGPLVELDVRTLYLKDLTFYGCTKQPKEVFSNSSSQLNGTNNDFVKKQSGKISYKNDENGIGQAQMYHFDDEELKRKGKTYEAMFQTYEGHCVTYCGEKASLEYLEIQEKFINKYLMN